MNARRGGQGVTAAATMSQSAHGPGYVAMYPQAKVRNATLNPASLAMADTRSWSNPTLFVPPAIGYSNGT